MKVKAGDIVECEFLDHVEDGGEPISFRVWGRVAVVGRKHYEILSWTYSDQKSESGDHNEKRWTIVKAAVVRITTLIPTTP